MSMWDWDEQGESYPPEDRQQYRDPHASHSGSSDYRGAHQSYRDHSHHQHGHTGHSHDQHHDQHHHQHHHEQDDAHSYHGQRSTGASPSHHHNYGVRHESYEDPGAHQNYGERGEEEGGGRQNYGWRDANDDQGVDQNSYGSPTHASNMAHAAARQGAHYEDNKEGYDSSAGYEIQQERHSPPPPTSGHGQEHEASDRSDLFTSDSVVNLTLDEIDALARTHRSRAWLVVLYAPWCRFCQV